ncbi:thiamine pyrophosphate-dependent enzyme, partial [Burkholderia pseudomallei]|uniref:thiamine pyrophosphate-dependent enzyme n=1 Tax=Burkholderia pseudomallei TaxID=28450 RepID=UPI0021F7BA77
RPIVALSADYDFHFMIDEPAAGAQFNLPYVHVAVNNAYLGLIRQAQRAFDSDYFVQLAFHNVNAPEMTGHGVGHVAVAEGLGCRAPRAFELRRDTPGLEHAPRVAAEPALYGGTTDPPAAHRARRDGAPPQRRRLAPSRPATQRAARPLLPPARRTATLLSAHSHSAH